MKVKNDLVSWDALRANVEGKQIPLYASQTTYVGELRIQDWG